MHGRRGRGELERDRGDFSPPVSSALAHSERIVRRRRRRNRWPGSFPLPPNCRASARVSVLEDHACARLSETGVKQITRAIAVRAIGPEFPFSSLLLFHHDLDRARRERASNARYVSRDDPLFASAREIPQVPSSRSGQLDWRSKSLASGRRAVLLLGTTFLTLTHATYHFLRSRYPPTAREVSTPAPSIETVVVLPCAPPARVNSQKSLRRIRVVTLS